jgi:hypothetical protein
MPILGASGGIRGWNLTINGFLIPVGLAWSARSMLEIQVNSLL